MNNPEGVARKIVGPINLLSKITKPFVWLLATLDQRGAAADRHRSRRQRRGGHRRRDVMLLMQEGAMQGSIEDDEPELCPRCL